MVENTDLHYGLSQTHLDEFNAQVRYSFVTLDERREIASVLNKSMSTVGRWFSPTTNSPVNLVNNRRLNFPPACATTELEYEEAYRLILAGLLTGGFSGDWFHHTETEYESTASTLTDVIEAAMDLFLNDRFYRYATSEFTMQRTAQGYSYKWVWKKPLVGESPGALCTGDRVEGQTDQTGDDEPDEGGEE